MTTLVKGQLGGRHFSLLYAVAFGLGQPLSPEVNSDSVHSRVGRALRFDHLLKNNCIECLTTLSHI